MSKYKCKKGLILLDTSTPNGHLPNVRTCSRCHKLLTTGYGISMLCSECMDKDKEDYHKVKEYIQSHANRSEERRVGKECDST